MADPWDDRAISPLNDHGKERLEQILDILEAPNTPETQQQILEELKKNPSLMFTFIKNRQEKALRGWPENTEQCLENPEQEQSQQSSVDNEETETSKRLENSELKDSTMEK